MGLLPLQRSVWHEAGEVAVLHAQLLDLRVEEVLDGLPDGEGPGPEDVAAGHVVVLHHLSFRQHLINNLPLESQRRLSDKSKAKVPVPRQR